MNKLFTKIAALALGAAMVVGVGVAAGVKELVPVYADSDYSEVMVSSSSSSYYSSGYFTGTTGTNKATWTGSHFSAEQLKNSSSNAVSLSYAEIRVYASHSFTVTPDSGYEIDSVVCEATTAAYATAIGGSSLTNCTKATSSTTVTLTPTDGSSTVGFTNSAQSRIKTITVNYSEASTATLSSIALSGSMTNTSYTTADAWDPTGLIVTGTYSDSSTKNLTAGASFTYYNSSDVEVATPKDLGVGSSQTLKVVASYTGVSDTAKYTASSSITVTKATEYELVTDPSKLTKGTTFMFVANSTVTKAMQQSRTTSNAASSVADVTLSDSFNSGSVAISANATIFTLDGSAGAWKIKNGDNQLGFTGTSNNNMQFNESQTDTFKIATQSGYLLSVESNTQSGRKLQYNYNSGSPRFSNYNGGQTYIYMFANIAEVSYGTTDHISVSTTPQTEFAVGETFNSTGLAITAWDGADESTANSKSVEVTSVSLAGTTFADADIGANTVTVTYTESGTDYTTTYGIYVYAAATYELVTEEPSGGWAGSYLITSEVSTATEAIPTTGTYAMKSSLENFDVVGNYASVTPVTSEGVTTITAGQHLQWSIASYSTGYSIQGHSGKYIGWNSSSNNGLNTSASALVNTISISSGNATILCSAGTKGLTLNSASGQFRYYSNSTVKLYKLVESSEATTYAQTFLNDLGSVCDAGGDSDIADLQLAWASLAIDFDALSNADKQLFTQGTADESGDVINQALALYDYVASKYSTRLESEDCSSYNFMSRSITPVSSGRLVADSLFGSDSTGTIAIVIVSVIGVSALGGFFFLRKRKEI